MIFCYNNFILWDIVEREFNFLRFSPFFCQLENSGFWYCLVEGHKVIICLCILGWTHNFSFFWTVSWCSVSSSFEWEAVKFEKDWYLLLTSFCLFVKAREQLLIYQWHAYSQELNVLIPGGDMLKTLILEIKLQLVRSFYWK